MWPGVTVFLVINFLVIHEVFKLTSIYIPTCFCKYSIVDVLPHAVNCIRLCFYRCLWLFFVCLWIKYLGSCWTYLRQIHREDMFGPLLGCNWTSRLKAKVTVTKNAPCTPITPDIDGMVRSAAWHIVVHLLHITSFSSRWDYSIAARGWFWQPACGLCLIKHL